MPASLVGQPCPCHVLFGQDDDENRLTVPSRQRFRQFPEKNDATAKRAPLHHRRVKTIIRLSVFVTLSADQCFPPKCAHKGPARCRITQDSCAHRPFKGECAQQKRIPRCLISRSAAHTLAKGVATKGNRRKPDRKASQRKAIDEGLPATTRAICPSCLCRGTKTAFSAGKPSATRTNQYICLCRGSETAFSARKPFATHTKRHICLCHGAKTTFSARKPSATHTERHICPCRDKRSQTYIPIKLS